jgi:hypothetical protein
MDINKLGVKGKQGINKIQNKCCAEYDFAEFSNTFPSFRD